MKPKRKIGLFFGGQSVEHEVSLKSMRSIFAILDSTQFEKILFPVSKAGKIYQANSMEIFDHCQSVDDLIDTLQLCCLDDLANKNLACIVSTLHGGSGENGAFQGFFEVLQIPYVGASVLGSSIAMDKEVTKRLLEHAGLPVVPFKSLRAPVIDDNILSSQGFPCFIKAASLGSSVGVFKCAHLEEAKAAAIQVYELDSKLLVEQAINGRELEVSVIGHEQLQASVAGEVIPHHEFYSYEAKYLDEQGASLQLPAQNVDHKQLQNLALKACETLEIRGMARVDFFVSNDKIMINEINTLPGFTTISMYPKLWKVSGLSYQDLVTRLIEEGIEAYYKNAQLTKTLYAKVLVKNAQE